MRFLGFLSLLGGSLLTTTLALAETRVDRWEPEAWPPANREVQISAEVRRERAIIIRDSAARAGLTNAALIAGIGEVETGFAHCWSEATWACQGPNSSSCEGGPVIAGSADGPCQDEQGGLGLFQFDSGTYTQTLATYGPEIVTMQGNVEAVVPFLVTRAVESVSGVSTESEALEWMNAIAIIDGDPEFERWLYFIAWRYNGCEGCTAQQDKYRDGTHSLVSEFDAEFWAVSGNDCAPISKEGATLEEDDACFEAQGPAAYWRSENSGHGGSLLWTGTTDEEVAANIGRWNLSFANAGSYQLDVFGDGGEFGQSQNAEYKVTDANGSRSIRIDQSSADGWVSLGVFDFEFDDSYQVRLDDNTGEATQLNRRLSVDALRVTPVRLSAPDEKPGGSSGGIIGACSSTGRKAPWTGPLWLAVCWLGYSRRRIAYAWLAQD